MFSVPASAHVLQRGCGRVQGQTRQHARLLCLLGVRQLCVGVNKMDCDVAGYKEERYNEIKDEMKHMLTKVCAALLVLLGTHSRATLPT